MEASEQNVMQPDLVTMLRKESANWAWSEGKERKCRLLGTMNFTPIKDTTPL